MSALSILYHIPSWFCLISLLERYADGLKTIDVKLQFKKIIIDSNITLT